MSEKKNSGDPFEGMDWDKELEDWDKSTAAPGGASVPDSFSNTPPPVEASPPTKRSDPNSPLPAAPSPAKPAAPPPGPSGAKPPRPLYRPPSVKLGGTKLGSSGPIPAAALPTGKPQVETPAPPPSSDRHLPSLLDEDDEPGQHDHATKAGEALISEPPAKPSRHEIEEEEERTVIAPVSRDLLAELEAAGFRRGGSAAKQTTPAETKAAPVEVDLGSIDHEPAAVKAPEQEEDPSVVTSAPDFVSKVRGLRKPVEAPTAAEPAEHADGDSFDPFKNLELEPPASKSIDHKQGTITSPPPPDNIDDLAGPGPSLLSPDERVHSPTAETKILDKRQIMAAAAAQATELGVRPQPAAPTDPFATPDPFGAVAHALAEPPAAEDEAAELETGPSVEESAEIGQENAVIDLLQSEESTGDLVQPGAAPTGDDARPASSWIGDDGETWRQRAERVANQARNRDKVARARGLVVASEIAAIAGDRAKAIELAEEAWSASPNDALAVRQLRQLLAADARWEEVAPLLESEAKSHGSPAVKAHAMLLAADAARLVRAAPDEAAKLYETAQRTASGDVRPLLARAVPAVASGKAPPLLRWPTGLGAEPLAEALTRRVKGGEPSEDLALAQLVEQLPAYAEGKGGADGQLAHALDELAGSATLGPAVQWLRLGLDAGRKASRGKALERLARIPEGAARDEARLALALDAGDRDAAATALAALSQTEPSARITLDRLALSALHGELDAGVLTPFAEDEGTRTVGRAVALAAGNDPPSPFATTDALDAEARVARRLAVGEHVDTELRARVSEAARNGFALADSLGSGSARVALDAISPMLNWPADAPAQQLLARMLVELVEGDVEAARTLAKQAAEADPTAHSAVLALVAMGDEMSSIVALTAAEATTDETRGAMLALGVAISALRRGDGELAKRAGEIAMSRTSDDALVAFTAELRGRRMGDFDAVVEAVRARAHANVDPVARANNLVREILLLLGTDLATCIERASEAAQLVPKDPSVRALYERIAGEGAQGRAEWRAELAGSLEGQAKHEMLLDAAREAERHGDLDAAEKHAQAAEVAGSGAEAVALRHRVQSRGDGAARLADELLELAKRTEDTETQREAYETLAELDLFTRKDAASAILWHRAILETTPGHLPSLRRLEQMLISEGREDDYETIASELAHVLPPEGRDAHAEVAARLRLRRPGTPWDSIADLIEAATQREHPSLWATRLLDALGRHRRDDAMVLRAMDLLLARVERPSEVATLASRAAEAAFRAGQHDRARAYLERALEADPHHPTALASLAELRRHLGDDRGAAEAVETLAQTQSVAEHRLEDWHAAALMWLDRVNDKVRGRAALERAAEIDFGYADVFERLVALAREARELPIVTDLYNRRLGQLEDVAARALLHVDFARVLIELGDRDSARASLAAALELVPGQHEALSLGAELAEKAEDWADVERYLLQLVAVVTEVDARVAIWRKLAALYETHLHNPQGAEQALQKILEDVEDDDDVLRRLVAVYVELGDGEQAVETHKNRVRIATDAVARRGRFIELAKLLDEVAGDPERALKALEQARAGDPADLTSLAALAEFHGKHGHPELVAPALDAALADLRQKLDEQPGDGTLLDHFTKILELRGRHDATKLVRAVVAALAGEPSPLVGAESAAADASLDDLLCPPELRRSIRLILDKAGEAIEKSIPVDLRALKAAKLGANQPAMKAKIDAVAHGFGLPDPDVVIARAMPLLCLPVGSKPFQIVVGEGIINSDDEEARRFALTRTMKLCGAHVASLVRVPPTELKVYIDALLHHLVPSHPAPEIEAERLDEMTKRLTRFIPRKDEPELKQLGATLVGEGLPSIDSMAGAAATWGDRVALLAIGDLGAALRGVAWTLGQPTPPLGDASAMREWLAANPAARDLVSFALSDAYLEARTRAGAPT